MKILLLGPFPVGNKGLNGQSIANKTLLDGLQGGHDVDFINTARDLEFTDKKDQGKFKIGKFLRILIGFVREIAKILFGKYDVIYMTPGQSFLGFMRFSPYMLVGFLKHTPCYVHIHGGYFRKMYDIQSKAKKRILTYFLNKLTGVIVLGESLRKMFEGLISDDHIFVCENGVQDDIIATEDEINQKLGRFNQKNKIKLFYLSNLMIEKGILEVLKIAEYFTNEEIEINIAGAIEPEIKNIFEEYLNTYSDIIKYHGIVSGTQKKELLLQNDIFILPTYYSNEGQPISILEAYVTGCSVITTYQGGIKDIFKDKVNGCICEAKDIKSIIEAINEVKTEVRYMRNNYLYGKKNFTSDKFIKRIKKIIK